MYTRVLTVTIIAFLSLLGVSAVPSTSAEAGHDQATISQDGDKIYREHCASCHDTGVPRAPARAALSHMSPDNIRFALTSGKMSAQGAELTRAQLDSLVRFLTGPPAAPGPAAPVNTCGASGALPADAELQPGWSGWGAGPDQHRYQPPGMTGLTSSQV